MNVITEKRFIAGTLKTLLGTYNLLELEVLRNSFDENLRPLVRQADGSVVFSVVDDEGFQNLLVVRGDFVVIPSAVPYKLEVKRIMTVKEEQDYKLESKLQELEPSQTNP